MPTELEPVAGNWYHNRDKGQDFTVVDYDEETGAIEIQYFDGTVEELDADDWPELDVSAREPPENWTGPIDRVEIDDRAPEDTDMSVYDWNEPSSDTHGILPPDDEGASPSERGREEF